jgi:2-hydroxychromene-2-carboxylate isomerase
VSNKAKIQFFFDFLSPFSYVAWTRIRNDETLDIEFYPVSIPNVVSFYETKGPGQIEPKRNYLMKDLLRFTKLNNIPFTTPPVIPFNSLYALRLALKSVSGSEQKNIIDNFFRAAWEQGQDIGDSELVTKILNDLKLPSAELMDKISSKEIRIELKKNTEIATSKGVFGVPTFFYNEEMFWGNDSINYLKLSIAGSDPLDQKLYKDFLIKHPFNL